MSLAVENGADIICIPSAFTTKTGQDHWETLVKARAIENKIYILETFIRQIF